MSEETDHGVESVEDEHRNDGGMSLKDRNKEALI